MFKRKCASSNAHAPHIYEKHWVKVDIPGLLHMEQLPEEWDTVYECPGRSVDAWTVEYLHENCTPCEACADMAVNRAMEHNSASEVWRELGLDEAIAHMAEVTRL